MAHPIDFAITLHLAAALTAIGLGALMIGLRKGSTLHRWLGRTWVAVMAVVAIGSFWIQRSGDLSWLHGLSAFTLLALAIAVWAIRRGDTATHRGAMLGTFAGLCIAGLFALAPTRLLGHWLIGG